MKVFLSDSTFDISIDELSYMMNKGLVKKVKSKYIIKRNTDFRFLFNNKISPKKRNTYFQGMIQSNFKCEICKKPHSYSISPYIDRKGNVDFNRIICVCKECRQSKLQQRDILKPIYKKYIDWNEEMAIINKKVNKYSIPPEKKDDYIEICKKIIIFDRYTKLILPKRDLTKIHIESKDIDLTNLKMKRELKKALYKDSKHTCPVCGRHTKYKYFTIDHITAKKLGGKDNIENFIGMCKQCNSKKGHKTIMEFLCTTELNYMPDKILKLASIQQREVKQSLDHLLFLKESLQT